MFLVWKAGATVAINQLIRDVANPQVGLPYGFNGGIFFPDGQQKPALTAFRFPFVTGGAGVHQPRREQQEEERCSPGARPR